VPINVDFEQLRESLGLTVAELAKKIGITQANLFVLKNNRGKAIRFSTLEALCRELDCQPGDILKYEPDDA
jgi:putative transcriptional regulator